MVILKCNRSFPLRLAFVPFAQMNENASIHKELDGCLQFGNLQIYLLYITSLVFLNITISW
jgi:hypothetical protein